MCVTVYLWGYFALVGKIGRFMWWTLETSYLLQAFYRRAKSWGCLVLASWLHPRVLWMNYGFKLWSNCQAKNKSNKHLWNYMGSHYVKRRKYPKWPKIAFQRRKTIMRIVHINVKVIFIFWSKQVIFMVVRPNSCLTAYVAVLFYCLYVVMYTKSLQLINYLCKRPCNAQELLLRMKPFFGIGILWETGQSAIPSWQRITSDHNIGVKPPGEAVGIFLVERTKQNKSYVAFWVNSLCTLLSLLFLTFMRTAHFRIMQLFYMFFLTLLFKINCSKMG